MPNLEKGKKQAQCFLFHGENEVEIHRERVSLIQSLLPPEEGRENVTEFEPPQGRLLSLKSVASDLMADLSMLSLLPDSKRIAVVYNLENFYSEKGATSDIEPYFARFLEKELPGTNNIVIFVNIESFEKKRIINKKSILYSVISKIGVVREFKETPFLWEIEPQILQRNAPACISLFRNWTKKDSGAPRKIFYLLVKIVNLLIQMKGFQNKDNEFKNKPGLEKEIFPQKMSQNIRTLKPFLQKRYQNAADLFSMDKLIWANKRLLEINKVVFPKSDDPYVPDLITVLEIFILNFLSVEMGEY